MKRLGLATLVALLPSIARGQEPTPAPLPAAADPGAAAATADADLQAELALSTLAADQSSGPAGPKLDLYGFADFNLLVPVNAKNNPWWRLASEDPSFAVGNLNLYLDGNLSDRWRSLIEVRFLYVPQGSTQVTADGTQKAQDNSLIDPAEPGHRIRWGGIEIQRAWLEYSVTRLLTIRGGQFLTPYGIWIVDHGSPTLIAIRRPFIIRDALLPEQQTGLELYGTWQVRAVELGYHLTLSNGRGPSDTYWDTDSNKAVGARLHAAYGSADTELKFGLAAYRGRSTASKVYQWLPTATVPTRTLKSWDFTDETAFAADLRLRHHAWYLQVESVLQLRQHPDDQRPLAENTTGKFESDSYRGGVYGLLGYRTPWWAMMPYALGEIYRVAGPGSLLPIVGDVRTVVLMTAGVNVRPRPDVTLKAEFAHAFYPDHEAGSWGDYKTQLFQLQAAWAF